MIFADREQDRAAALAAAKSVGARVIGSERIADAGERLNRQAAVDSVLIEVSEDTPQLDRLLEWANHAARNGTAAPIISLPRALIDLVAARIDEPKVALLCDATVEDRTGALAFAVAERKHRLHDQGVEADAERLRRLSEEVARIAGALAELSTTARVAAYSPFPVAAGGAGEEELDADKVRALIRVRRLRDQFFPKDLFADPAWDMLLDLMAARLEQSRVAVSSLCIAAAVPATTALRWIRTLTEHGLFVRRHDTEDGRRIFIELSDGAADALAAYFRTVHQMGVRLG
ncbi:winged helix DNA-binding protein [Sphingomonas sp. ID1715]|uniref:winged helix DNA-binding protein n=1 Tax=Sphingomonas sp. ID1715 TaxID=1656898 RepID=UPI001487AE60|nr:winged helix DNA-binding protein [Sphingomonas sp. ID1715]